MTTKRIVFALAVLFAIAPGALGAPDSKDKPKDKTKDKAKSADAKADDKSKLKSDTFGGLAFRGIGPAMISGRITDIAVDPRNDAVRYATAGSGNVWKTTNAGTTWSPIFDGEKSYSIGCIALDPKNPLTVWIGRASCRERVYGLV